MTSTAKVPRFSESKLRKASAADLHYEVSMLCGTADQLRQLVQRRSESTHEPSREDILVGNAVVASFAIHARNLVIFFYPEMSKRKDGDVVAPDFIEDLASWQRTRPRLTPALKTALTRTGQEIAHLTIQRHPDGWPAKLWNLNPIERDLLHLLRIFLQHALSTRLDPSVRELIAELPDPPPPGRRQVHNTPIGVKGPDVATELGTERLSNARVTTDPSTTAVPRLGILPTGDAGR